MGLEKVLGADSACLTPLTLSQAQSRQVKILTDTPLERSYSYGKVLNTLTYAFFNVLMPILYTIFSAFRHHVVELINLKRDLVQNKFDALQAVLESPKYDEIAFYADHRDYAGFIAHVKSDFKKEAPKSEVLNLVRFLIPYSLLESTKRIALEFAQEADSSLHQNIQAIESDDPFHFLRQAIAEAKDYPETQRKLRVLVEAVQYTMDSSRKEVVSRAKTNLKDAGFDNKNIEKTLESLAGRAAATKNVREFLLKEKAFGTDPEAEVFQAGYILLMNHLDPIRDTQFLRSYFDLVQNLRNSSDEDQFGYHVGRQIRDLAFLASQSPLYQRLQNQMGRSSPYVALVQDLCTTLHMKIPGMRELRELGQMYLNQIKETHGALPEEGKKLTYLADAMDAAVKKHRKFSFESFKDRALTDNGKFDIALGKFQLGDHELHAALGAFKRDRALEPHLESLKERGGIHLHQGVVKSSSYLRQLESKYPSVLRVFSMPLGDLKNKSYFLKFDSAEEFFMKYAKYALRNQTTEDSISIWDISDENHRKFTGREDNGFYFGHDVMSNDQFKLAFEKCGEAFAHVNPQLEDRERLAEALKLGVQGFLTVGALVKTMQDLPVGQKEALLNATYKQAFEESVDRGIVVSVLTEVYFHLLSGEPLTEETIKGMIGAVIARAELIVGYRVTMSDYQMLSDLLRIIGSDENRVRSALQSYLQQGFGTSSKCKFEPFIALAPDRAKRKKITTEREIFEGRKLYSPIRNKGAYGSIIYRDRNGIPYGIFKSIDGSFSWGKKVQNKALGIMGFTGQEGYLPLPQMRQVGAMISERATYLLDRAFFTNSVPKTEIIYAQGHKGSFQHFVHGYKEAGEVELPKEVSERELTKYQKFVIIDYILGNLDRKEDNWMVKMSENGKRILDIKMIDNANCFPRGHLPATYLPDGSKWNQYAWKGLELSAKPLTKSAKDFIDSLTDSKMQKLIEIWKSDLGPEYFEEFFGGENGEAIKAFQDRINVVRKFKERSEAEALDVGTLASYNTYESIDSLLGFERKAGRAQYVFSE